MKTLLNKERVARACQAVDAKGSKNSFWLGFLGGEDYLQAVWKIQTGW